MSDTLILTQCAVMCGLQKLEEICEYGKSKRQWLAETFGICRIPSPATLCRILDMTDAEAVTDCVVEMMKADLGVDGEQVAFDGKTICATAKEMTQQERLHIV